MTFRVTSLGKLGAVRQEAVGNWLQQKIGQNPDMTEYLRRAFTTAHFAPVEQMRAYVAAVVHARAENLYPEILKPQTLNDVWFELVCVAREENKFPLNGEHLEALLLRGIVPEDNLSEKPGGVNWIQDVRQLTEQWIAIHQRKVLDGELQRQRTESVNVGRSTTDPGRIGSSDWRPQVQVEISADKGAVYEVVWGGRFRRYVARPGDTASRVLDGLWIPQENRGPGGLLVKNHDGSAVTIPNTIPIETQNALKDALCTQPARRIKITVPPPTDAAHGLTVGREFDVLYTEESTEAVVWWVVSDAGQVTGVMNNEAELLAGSPRLPLDDLFNQPQAAPVAPSAPVQQVAKQAMNLTPEELAERRKGIGATDACAIAGDNPYRGPFEVWLSKVRGTEQDDNAPMEWGRRLEEPIFQKFLDQHPGATGESPGMLWAPDPSWMFATVDRLVRFPRDRWLYDVEIKTSAEDPWPEVPQYYVDQVLWQLMTLDRHRPQTYAQVAVMCALFLPAREFKEYTIARNPEREAFILARVTEFRERYIVTRAEPPLDLATDQQAAVRALYEKNDGRLVKVSDLEPTAASRALKLCADFHTWDARAKFCDQTSEKIKVQLESMIQDHDGLQVLGEGLEFTPTFKSTKPSQKVDWEAVAKELGATPDVIAKHTALTGGSRRWAFKVEEIKEGGK